MLVDVLSVLLLCLGVPATTDERPAILLKVEETRAAIRATMYVRSYMPGASGIRHRAVVVEDGMAVYMDGAEDGTAGFDEKGAPVKGSGWAALVTSEGVWSKRYDELGATLRTGPAASSSPFALDFRALGLNPDPSALALGSRGACAAGLGNGEGIQYEERDGSDGLRIVEARASNGVKRIWYLNPDLDFNPVRVEDWRGGQVVRGVECDYERINDTWVVRRVEHLGPSNETLGISDIEYDKVGSGDLPQTLSPRDIGLLAGASVNVSDGLTSSQMKWTGDRTVSLLDWANMVRSGAGKIDPALQRVWDEAKAKGSAQVPITVVGPKWPTESVELETAAQLQAAFDRVHAATQPVDSDAWDRYVEDFIRKYGLSAEQAEKCRSMLREAKDARSQHYSRRAGEYKRLREMKLETEGDRRIAKAQLERLSRPVDRLFEALKARLEKVPSQKQREAAVKPK